MPACRLKLRLQMQRMPTDALAMEHSLIRRLIPSAACNSRKCDKTLPWQRKPDRPQLLGRQSKAAKP